MEPHETDCEDSQGDNGGDDEPSVEQHRLGNLPPFFESVANSLQAGELGQPDIETQSTYSDDSEYSLDYEYQGPRDPKYRPKDDPDSDASELSDGEKGSGDPPSSGFDMWDEDPYSTNDYTWELNDMRLTSFIKARRRELTKIDSIAPWKGSSFWRKEKGWPKQMPFSCSTTNHDQSANALCLVLSDYGATETLYAVYRDRIIECGQPPCHSVCDSLFREPGISGRLVNSKFNGTLTWIDSDQDAMMQADPSMQAGSSMRSRNVNTQPGDPAACSTNPDRNTAGSSSNSSNNNNNSNSNQRNPPSRSKFCETHLSVSLRSSLPPSYPQLHTNTASSKQRSSLISHFIPFTKFIKRADFPPIYPQDSYLALEFEPLCLAQKYGYMAIGGLEGEFELYCCMDQKRPRKIWGTKFKSRNNVQLMTNAIQIVRWKRVQHTSMDNSDEYDYMLISCMNEAGILVYKLPSHRACQSSQSKNYYTIKRRRSSSKRDASESSSSNTATSYHHPFVEMHSHLRFFDGMPINDAKISPDGKQLACVGDDNFVFLVDVQRDSISGDITFGTVTKLTVPLHQLKCSNGPAAETPYSSQYVTWSPSSRLFAHSSDTHSSVLVWRADTRQILYTIDAAGYTYAITFHPFFEGLLTFSNRYGYFHTVNLDEKISIKQNGNEDLPMHSTEESWSDDSVQGAVHLRHEITMVSFRGERDRRLRILAKINGLQWSKDGRFLYVATKKRVLAYELSKLSGTIKSLFDISSEQIRQILEDEEELDSRCAEPSFVPAKRRSIGQELPRPNIREQSWFQKWASLPSHLQYRIVDQKNLASHW